MLEESHHGSAGKTCQRSCCSIIGADLCIVIVQITLVGILHRLRDWTCRYIRTALRRGEVRSLHLCTSPQSVELVKNLVPRGDGVVELILVVRALHVELVRSGIVFRRFLRRFRTIPIPRSRVQAIGDPGQGSRGAGSV